MLILFCPYFSPGLLFLSAPLDYEAQRLHHLTIRAVDHGLPPLSSTQTFTVEVGDVNDRSPVFSQSIYNASVAENRDPGEPVVRVSATDDDSGKNGQNITRENFLSFKDCGAFLCLCFKIYCT